MARENLKCFSDNAGGEAVLGCPSQENAVLVQLRPWQQLRPELPILRDLQAVPGSADPPLCLEELLGDCCNPEQNPAHPAASAPLSAEPGHPLTPVLRKTCTSSPVYTREGELFQTP